MVPSLQHLKKKFILASTSSIRAKILRNSGIALDSVVDSQVSEKIEIKKKILTKPKEIALYLAEKKAMSVSRSYKQDYVIGCDQILCLGGKILHKPRTPEGVAERLFMLSGKDHILYSAICVVKNENVMWSHCSVAVMKVRTLESDFIDWYVRNFSEKVKSSVGGYHFEEEGIQIFEKVKGDYFTILGIPLLPLLNFLYSKECT